MTEMVAMSEKADKPLVSVIVPNYNYGRYLKDRIASVLNQTYTNVELILLDDASTDNSVDILKEYKAHPKVAHVVVNTENTGSPFVQWMKGILQARGKYVWIAEADDLAEPEFLESCIEKAEMYPDTSVCYAGSYLMDSVGKVAARRDPNHWGGREKKGFSRFDGRKFAEHNLYWKNYIINASAVIFRREYAEKLSSSSFLSMRYCGDWLFWFEMSMQGSVIEVYQRLNYFRQHAQKATFASHKAGEGVKEDMMVVKAMEEGLPELDSYKKRLRRGLLYKKIKRQRTDDAHKALLYDYLSEVLGGSVRDFRLERWNKYIKWLCPHLPTVKRERL